MREKKNGQQKQFHQKQILWIALSFPPNKCTTGFFVARHAMLVIREIVCVRSSNLCASSQVNEDVVEGKENNNIALDAITGDARTRFRLVRTSGKENSHGTHSVGLVRIDFFECVCVCERVCVGPCLQCVRNCVRVDGNDEALLTARADSMSKTYALISCE